MIWGVQLVLGLVKTRNWIFEPRNINFVASGDTLLSICLDFGVEFITGLVLFFLPLDSFLVGLDLVPHQLSPKVGVSHGSTSVVTVSLFIDVEDDV